MSTQADLFSRPATELVPGLRYVPDFVAPSMETAVLADIDARPWLGDLKRRVQHYGYKYDYKARSINRAMFVGALPPFAIELATKLVNEHVLAELPDQMIVNEYQPGQGISAHIDCEPCFKERIVTISLGSACEMEFIRADDRATKQALMLQPRSALLIMGEARYQWMHTIRARQSDHGVKRSRRVSLTFRNVVLEAPTRSK